MSSQRASYVVKLQVGGLITTQAQRLGISTGVEKDNHWNHAVGLEQFSQIQTVVCQAMNGEAPGLGLLLNHKEQGGALAIGPFHKQRDVQFMEPVAEPFLQLFLANRHDARVLEMRRFRSGEEF